jgi:hypothetical protein
MAAPPQPLDREGSSTLDDHDHQFVPPSRTAAVLPENPAPSKLTVLPENLAMLKLTAPPENSA